MFMKAATALLGMLALTSGASAQCNQWIPALGTSAFDGITVMTTWDPDGDGPLPPVLVVGGTFTSIGSTAARHIAMFDGTTWSPIGNGFNNNVWALTTWDPDGNGPLPPILIAGGTFRGNGEGVDNVAYWTGTGWGSFGWSVDGGVFALTTWDPDGPGPLPPLLVAGGDFIHVGSDNTGELTTSHIASWDGASWRGLGSGIAGSTFQPPAVYALTNWDPDGPGPLPPQLVVGGSFTSAGGVTANNIASWNGTAWQALGAGFQGPDANYVLALTSWDPDGPGPLPAQLIAAGSLDASGAVPIHNVARWTGSVWQPMGAGIDEAWCLSAWDTDGAGPLAPRLVAGCAGKGAGGHHGAMLWDGAAWQGLGLSGSEVLATAVTPWQPPDAPQPLLMVGGSFATPNLPEGGHLVGWDGSTWQTYGMELNNTVNAFTFWDPDGAGPLPPVVVAGGLFTPTALADAGHVGFWNGGRWVGLGWGCDGPVNAVTTWDPDGAGPLPAQLIAAGLFPHVGADLTGEVLANNIALWNGLSWQSLAQGLPGEVRAIISWDPDGAGPLPPLLIACGAFNGTGSHDYIASWNGVAWNDLGWGLDGTVRTLALWDPDGPGPLGMQLIAGGDFLHAGADSTGEVLVNHIARWDGSAWYAFGAGFNGSVSSLLPLSGPGPGPGTLIVGGSFTTPSSSAAVWDGAAWHAMPFSAGTLTQVSALTLWDLDGTDRVAPQPIAAAAYTHHEPADCIGCCGCDRTVNALLRWDGQDWQQLGLAGSVHAFIQSSVPGEPATLIVGSDGGILAHAPWSEPIIISQPPAAEVSAGAQALFPVDEEGGTAFIWYWTSHATGRTYQLTDGPSSTGSTIAGVTTDTLILSNITLADAGTFSCVIGNACGSSRTNEAALTVHGCGSGDFNGDGDVGTDQDVEAFFACIAGHCCATCGSADFNGDGDVGTDQDIQAFFRVLAGGSC